MFKLVVILLVALYANGSQLKLLGGKIQAHTEVFGDRHIDPATTSIGSELSIKDSIESLQGKIFIHANTLVSEKKDRDENMYELLNVVKFPTISVKIHSLTKIEEDKYKLVGILTLNGVSKKITSDVVITETGNMVTLNGSFDINLTSYDMEPPVLLFLTVRDQIDISYNLKYKKEM